MEKNENEVKPCVSKSYSRRFMLKSGLIATSLSGLATSNAELILSEGIFDSFKEQPIFEFSEIQSQCQAMKDTGIPVHLFASSGFGNDAQRNLRGLHRLTQAGFYIDNPEVIQRTHLRFAGTDEQRLYDFSVFLKKPVEQLPKILLGVRGGYGAMRLLNGFSRKQWQTLIEKFKERGTLLIGFSDVTALQLAVLAQGNMPYIAGAMLGSDFGREIVNENTIQSFINLCTQPKLTIRVDNPQPYQIKKRLTGKLWGGNLSVLSALVGTPFMPDIEDGILFIEDVGEQPYRIERLLQTLYLSGILAKQQAIILGKFNLNGINDVYDENYTFDTVIRYVQQVTKLPIYTDFPFGHVAERINFPLGVPVTLEKTTLGYQAVFDQLPNNFPSLTQEKNYHNLNLNQLMQ